VKRNKLPKLNQSLENISEKFGIYQEKVFPDSFIDFNEQDQTRNRTL